MTIKEAQINLAEIVQQVVAEDKRVILTQDGKAIAAVISIEVFDFPNFLRLNLGCTRLDGNPVYSVKLGYRK